MYVKFSLIVEYDLLENDRKMTFSEKNPILSILGAQARAHGCDDVQNKFFDHCRVGFHFELLSLGEN